MTMVEMTTNFWTFHGVWFIIFMMLFPRLTMLITGTWFAPWAGVLFWLGWVFVPRITVAILACHFYFDTNPVLCVLSWFWALGGEFGEKTTTVKRASYSPRYPRR